MRGERSKWQRRTGWAVGWRGRWVREEVTRGFVRWEDSSVRTAVIFVLLQSVEFFL